MAVFVFGSNLAGKHYGGAARTAFEKHGAIMHRGEGIQGDSYALPTMDADFRPLKINEVKEAVDRFLQFAEVNPQLDFHITAVGCGIAGFAREDIAPMFKSAPPNCFFFEDVFGKKISEKKGVTP